MTMLESKFESRRPIHSIKPTYKSAAIYRDRIYIVKDIIMKLLEYDELNLTTLTTFCGLNMNKHKSIIERLEINGLISRHNMYHGHRVVSNFKITPAGIEFCRIILEPYEKLFPRK